MKRTREEFIYEDIFTKLTHRIKAVEVGVGEGLFSETLLAIKDMKEFYGVDPYLKYPEYLDTPIIYHNDSYYDSQEGLDTLYTLVYNKYSLYSNATLLRQTSVDAALNFSDEYFDFVYIDANHSYSYVMQDLESWWPKVAPGGFLCGDDYEPAGAIDFEVIEAVNDFCNTNNLTLNVADCWWKQWWVLKE